MERDHGLIYAAAEVTQAASHPMTRLALASRDKVLHVLVVAVGCLGLAIYFSDALFGLFILVCGATLIGLGAVILCLGFFHDRAQRKTWSTTLRLIEHDSVPSFGTDRDGRVLFRNPAALDRFGDGRGDLLSDVLVNFFASPVPVLHRMRMQADANGAAREDIAATRGTLRIAVHRVDRLGYVWRLDQNLNDGGTEGGVSVGLPMMRVTRANTIASMNGAMLSLLGQQPKTLDRVVAELPLAPGRTHQIETATGGMEAHLAVVEEDDGMRQVFIWPGQAPGMNWTHFDAIPVPMVKISTKGEILMSNRRARKLLAIDDQGNLDFSDLVEGMGRPIDEWLMDISDGRGADNIEVVRATRPQKDVYLQVALGRMVEEGTVSLLAVLIDATELKTLEAKFVQSQKMQAIGQLAGGVAHDFNNLLTAISGHCDLLLLRHEPGDPEYGDLVQINQNANRAASLVGQLLAFSRKQNLQPELIDLRDTLGDLTHLLNRLVGEKINLSWTHDPALPHIRADKRQLEQVLMNLVVNARDAMPDGGNIRVETRSVNLNEPLTRDRARVPAGDYVLVTVQDEGCGIAADKLPKIFEPFYSTKKVGEGTGLGLSMAYGIVKQSGGFIFADSVVGNGTAFAIYFPAHSGTPVLKPVSDAKSAKKPVQPEGGVVLLVEDEAPVRAFAGRALRLRGFTVIEADSAEQALETLEDSALHVDIFVTDVVMPGMDGPTWVSRALKMRPGVKVVFVSGYAEDSFSHTRAKIPNSVFLPKPFSLSELTKTVQEQMQ